MNLFGEITLKRHHDGRWYLMELGRFGSEDRMIGRPEGYPSFFEGQPYRLVYQRLKELQRG